MENYISQNLWKTEFHKNFNCTKNVKKKLNPTKYVENWVLQNMWKTVFHKHVKNVVPQNVWKTELQKN